MFIFALPKPLPNNIKLSKLNMKQLIFFFLLLLSTTVNAQFQDDFSDGDFTNNPTWMGQTDKFIVNDDGELQLNDLSASGSSETQILAAVNTADSTTWEFLIRQEFSASGSNFSEVYLSSNINDLTGEVNGYLVKVGGISGSDDVIELIRQSGNTRDVLISGTTGAAATDPLVVRIKVERDNAANWSLFVDYTGGTNYQLEGTANDAAFSMGSFFGLVAHYTSTRSDKIFLDDVLIEPLFVDVFPPEIISASSTSETSIDVVLNEELDENTANNANNYSISGGLTVISAELDASNSSLVHLTLNSALNNGETYTVTVNNVTDLNGNAISNATIDFTYFFFQVAESFDILINEFMADPNDENGQTLGLPNAEFVEIYNRSSKTINLEGIELASGSNPQMLPNYVLQPNSYVILCDDEFVADFSVYGATIGVPSFPALSNGGDEIMLTSPEGLIIDALEYNSNWYQNNSKSDGGWTLERIRPNFPCDVGPNNWRASENGNGGTPGQENSIVDHIIDEQSPDLQRVFPINETQLRLFFDEALTENTVLNLNHYEVEGLTLSDAELEAPFYNTLKLSFSTPMQVNTIYTINIKNNVEDCVGNKIGVFNTARFALPESLDTMDIVLNEILFDPESGGSDFVELYNRSSKNLNIGDLIIANRDEEGELDVARPISINYLLFPGDYVVLTENALQLQNQYLEDVADQAIQISRIFIETDLPTFPNDEGEVVIYIPGILEETIIDEFAYTEDFHYALLDDEEGVSLERIHPNTRTQDASNWHSASAKVFFGTPGYQNSQFFATTTDPNTTAVFDIPNSTFSPDGDGFEDFLLVNYLNDKPGYTANIRIFDANGRLVKDLAKNELLAIEGSIKWDGLTDEQNKARIGIYVLWIELFHPDGDIQHFKETVVVAAQF